MNMFKPTEATTVEAYLEAVPLERKETILFFHNLIQNISPDFKPHFAYNMLGYGSFPYLNYKNERVEWPIVALANQKHYISIYVCAVDNGEYLAEKFKKDLGKVNVGRSCIRFKKREDVHIAPLKKLLKQAAANPGLMTAGNHKKK